MYYECSECGMIAGGALDGQPEYRPCPECDERTRWEPAFEAEP